MARIPNGILGEFIGTAGPVSGYMRNGGNFLRSRRRCSNKPMTEKRLAQQQKIRVCNEFTKPFSQSGFFNKTFPGYGSTATGYNRATSALLHQAITGNYPYTALAYPLVLISRGQMPSPEDAAASLNAEGNVEFTWTNNSGNGTAKDNDKAILVAYAPSLQQAVYAVSDGRRKDGHAILNTQMFTKCVIETWMGFISNDEKDAATSVYTGRLM